MPECDRAGRRITEQVGHCGRCVAEAAKELGCDGHTVNDDLLAYGEALIDDDPPRYGLVEALGVAEVLIVREGEYRRQCFSTRIVEVERATARRRTGAQWGRTHAVVTQPG